MLAGVTEVWLGDLAFKSKMPLFRAETSFRAPSKANKVEQKAKLVTLDFPSKVEVSSKMLSRQLVERVYRSVYC